MNANLAMLEVPLEDGAVPSYGVRTVAALQTELTNRRERDPRLRVFMHGPAGQDLPATTIESLRKMANEFAGLFLRRGAQVDSAVADARADWKKLGGSVTGPLWFALEASSAIQPLKVRQVYNVANRLLSGSLQDAALNAAVVALVEIIDEPRADRGWQLVKDLLKINDNIITVDTGAASSYHAAKSARPASAAAVERRKQLLDMDWPDSKQVGAMLGSKETGAETRASRERSNGNVLGVWAGRDTGYVHPDFQFLASGGVNPRVADLLDALANNPGMSPPLDKSGWQRAFWLYQPRGQLSEQALAVARIPLESLPSRADELVGLDDTPRTPAEVFAGNEQAVIDLARHDARDLTPPDTHEGKDAGDDA